MHLIITTPGFIINSKPSGEAGKMLYIFTCDLGLIMASAQGIRLEKSKLRYHTQDYSFGLFSFVKGNEIRRLTSAGEWGGVPPLLFKERAGVRSKPPLNPLLEKGGEETRSNSPALVARIASLLKRLLHGEEAHPELFDIIVSCINFLRLSSISEDEIQTLESITVLRILHELGYIGDDEVFNGLLTTIEISSELLKKCQDKRVLINKHINKALVESHL